MQHKISVATRCAVGRRLRGESEQKAGRVLFGGLAACKTLARGLSSLFSHAPALACAIKFHARPCGPPDIRPASTARKKAARFSRNPSIFAETGNPNGMGMDMGNMGMDMGNMGMGMGAGTTGMGEHVGGYKTHGY